MNLTLADALRLAVNVLKDVAESVRMPSGIDLDPATAALHGDAADALETSLADLKDHE